MPISVTAIAIPKERLLFLIYLCFFIDLSMLVQYLQRPGEGVWGPRTSLTGECELSYVRNRYC